MLEFINSPSIFWESQEVYGDYAIFPEEEVGLGQVLAQRRREFATGRACARRAIRAMGLEPGPIPMGPNREPIWPLGVTGSITHCPGFCGAVVAATARIKSLGIDAEENLPLPSGVLGLISSPKDQMLPKGDADSMVCWDRLLFCAKESVFKAWYGITGAWLDFEECTIDWLPSEGLCSWGRQVYSGTFLAKLDRFFMVDGNPKCILQGRFVFSPHHVVSMVVVSGAAG